MAPEPRPDGKIVELATCESFIEAEAVIAQLDDVGIQAMRGADEGSLPNLAAAGGFPVLVFEDDLAAAQAALAAEDSPSSD